MIYADTSFLFSYYSSDNNSARADAWRLAHPIPLLLTPLHRVELRNASELAVFQKRATSTEAAQAWQTVESDLRDGFLLKKQFSFGDLLRDAETLAKDHTAHVGTRSLDVLQVAAAVLLGATELVTFDQRQVALANRIGLRVTVP